MFEKIANLFKKNKLVETDSSASEQRLEDMSRQRNEAIDAGVKRGIEEHKNVDPFIGAKIGAKEINQRLLHALKEERGVSAPRILRILGSLAGYACQEAVRGEMIAAGRDNWQSAFIIIEDKKGRKYYSGDVLYSALLKNKYSVFGIVCGAANQLGCSEYPDMIELVEYVTHSIGTERFGIPRFPGPPQDNNILIQDVRALWPVVLPILMKYCDQPKLYPISLSIALQEIIRSGKDVIPPKRALSLIMECAVPMSKIDIDADYS
ncbi:MAG: hypothetical protein HQL84_04975 [Magnetococcales bacterium]|nr:hypothetical protein [Magnetococcales bacterium]MBF0149383.1 hypothetical protein [Magnetococcales bacterium]